MAKIDNFKKVEKEDTRVNNHCVTFLSGVLAVFMATGFNEAVAVACCKCFGFGLSIMVIDIVWQFLKGNFDQIKKTERKEVNKKEA